MKTRLLILLVVAHLLGACASPQPLTQDEQTSSTLQRIQEALASDIPEPAADDTQVPDAVDSALLPPLRMDPVAQAEVVRQEPRFDLSVNDVRARPFFMSLVKDSPYNMVVHPSVDGTISLHLKNVTVSEVMRTVRDVYGFEFETTGTGFVVMPVRLRSRIFHVSYVNLTRSGQSTIRVASGQVSEARKNSNGEGDEDTVERTLGTKIVTETEAGFWLRIRASVEAIIGEVEGRSVVVSPQAGLVVVRAMPGELRDVGAFLQAAQASLHKQVILEAKVIEVQLSDAFQAGINWAALGSNDNGSIGAAQTTLLSGAIALLDPDGNLADDAVVRPGDIDNFPFGNLFAIGAATDEFAALITLLNTQGDAQVLSSPRVATINNQKAVIKVGTDEFFVTDIESTTTTGTATTTTPKIKLTPFFSGIALDVTPHITNANEVILHIHPTVSEVEDQIKDITVAGQTQTLPLAFSSVRESDSIVRARNGQVIVIGGLMQDSNRTDKGKTPFLGDLPLVGKLFQQERDVSARSELVILLRPVVVDSAQVWQDEVQDVSRRMGSFYATP
ncbi:MAG: pilus (MSHA type) biogenesis protein MshL [Gammaproteobacteria bacterium]|nr:pilus (MSHA type) biogenesis protein MshL [Gammaproteobacteria bacterium]